MTIPPDLIRDADEVVVINRTTNPVNVVFIPPAPPTGAVGFSDQLVTNLAGNNTATKDKTIPEGKRITIQQTTGRLASTDTGNQDILARYIFQPGVVGQEEIFEIGRDVYSGAISKAFSAPAGSGSKALRIEVKNGTTSQLWLSASYTGYQEDIPT